MLCALHNIFLLSIGIPIKGAISTNINSLDDPMFIFDDHIDLKQGSLNSRKCFSSKNGDACSMVKVDPAESLLGAAHKLHNIHVDKKDGDTGVV